MENNENPMNGESEAEQATTITPQTHTARNKYRAHYVLYTGKTKET